LKHLLFFILIPFTLYGQAFKEDIERFKKADSIGFPPKNAILFIGSSSFTNWTDVQAYFPNSKIINRGFGGSSLTDLIYFENEIIFRYEPKQIVIYCGENDIAGDSLVDGEVVFKRFETLFKDIRRRLPNTNVSYVSMKPSPSRLYMIDKVQEGNKLISNYISNQKNTHFIDIFYSMLTADGKPNEALFLEDRLHMKKSGYEIWQKSIAPYLIK
jgi:lysophospholipase L1-like esterase